MTSSKYKPDDNKLRELVLYIAVLSEGDPAFGKVKLNKLLFFADFTAYLSFGKPITGHEYQKTQGWASATAVATRHPSTENPAR